MLGQAIRTNLSPELLRRVPLIVLSNKYLFILFRGITWRTKEGIQTPNYFGSITQASTVRLGEDENGEDIFVPLSGVVPMVSIKIKP